MELSMMLGQILAVVYLVAGLSLLANAAWLVSLMNRMKDHGLALYYAGFMNIVLGMLIVLHHNIWTGWPAIVTIIGWLALIKGIWVVLMPKSAAAMTGRMASVNTLRGGAITSIILGIVLAALAF